MSKSSDRRRYEFIKANQHDSGIKPMCRCHRQLRRASDAPAYNVPSVQTTLGLSTVKVRRRSPHIFEHG